MRTRWAPAGGGPSGTLVTLPRAGEKRLPGVCHFPERRVSTEMLVLWLPSLCLDMTFAFPQIQGSIGIRLRELCHDHDHDCAGFYLSPLLLLGCWESAGLGGIRNSVDGNGWA